MTRWLKRLDAWFHCWLVGRAVRRALVSGHRVDVARVVEAVGHERAVQLVKRLEDVGHLHRPDRRLPFLVDLCPNHVRDDAPYAPEWGAELFLTTNRS